MIYDRLLVEFVEGGVGILCTACLFEKQHGQTSWPMHPAEDGRCKLKSVYPKLKL